MGDLTKDFSRAELACPCAKCNRTGPVLTAEALQALQDLRDAVGEPLRVTVGVRCVEHNAAIGGAPDSRHLPEHADAVDIACGDSEQRGLLLRELIWEEEKKVGSWFYFNFIEICPNHIHLDCRTGPFRVILGEDK